jgi:hypothetical protein
VSSLMRRAFIGIALIGFLAFGCLTWASWPGSDFLKSNRFDLTIYPRGRESGMEISKALKDLGYESVIQDADRVNKVKCGYRVVFFYEDEEMLQNLHKLLSSKKVYSTIRKDKETEKLFLQIGDVYQDKAKAEKVSQTAQNITVLSFEVEESYKEFPFQGKIVLLESIPAKEIEKIETAVAQLTDDPVKTVPAGENGAVTVNNGQ